MREEACSADTIIRDEDALREPYVREGEQTLTKIIDALKSGTDLSSSMLFGMPERSRISFSLMQRSTFRARTSKR